jgi:hypothetical protein
MSQAGYTPIQLYHSTTASALPSSGNLANGELALNLADKKLYAKNSGGTVFLLASEAGTAALVSSVDVSGGTTGLTTTGGPITTSGTITLGGILNLVNGGTGSSTQSGARTNLGLGSMAVQNSSSVSITGGTISNITLTGSTIDASLNTLSNIANASLLNSSITLGSTPVALGGTLTTLTGVSISGSTNTLTNIANGSLTNSSVTIGTTNIALGATALTLAGVTSITVTQDPTTGLQLATKQYVDNISGTGLHIHSPVRVETPTALTATYANGGTTPTVIAITGTDTLQTSSAHSLSVGDVIVFGANANGITAGFGYFVQSTPAADTMTLAASFGGAKLTGFTNGTGLTITSRANSGVGATLTNAGTQTALVIDGVTLSVSDRVLVLAQASAFQNGVYTVTNVGSGATNWVLTRATTENVYNPNSPNGLGEGDYFYVTSGLTGIGQSYVMTTAGTIIFGTTNLVFSEFSSSQVYFAGTGLTLSGTQFSITNTAVTAGSYGSASAVGTFTVNAQGQLTAASNASISINANQITSGTVDTARISGSYTGITGVGTLTAGTWNASLINPTYGGTGVNNGSNTITLSGNLSFSGAYNLSVTLTGATSITLPTSGTLVNTAVTSLSSLSTVGTITSGTWNATLISPTYGGTGVNNGSSTLTMAGNVTHAGSFTQSFTATGNTAVTLPTTGTLATLAGTETLTNKTVQARVVAVADATSITPNADTSDIVTQANTQAVGTLTVNAPTGTPVNGQKFILRLRSTNVQTLSWNAAYTGSIDMPLPTASSGATRYDYFGFIYNSTSTTWQLIAKNFGF